MGVMLELEFEMPDVRGDEAAGDVDDVMSLVNAYGQLVFEELRGLAVVAVVAVLEVARLLPSFILLLDASVSSLTFPSIVNCVVQ
jgi:hypothetical protein